MCGRFASTKPADEIKRAFGTLNPTPNLSPHWNIAPTQSAPVVRFNSRTGERALDQLRWGLIPHWAKDDGMSASLINARADGVATKPSFREAFHLRRCLIPADAFYEWKQDTKPKVPYAIARADGSPFAMAGLWENWKNPDGAWIRTFTIITTSPNDLMATLHNRMPVIVAPEDYGLWLGDVPTDTETLRHLLKPCPSSLLEAYPVSTAVNSVRNDGPELLARAV